MKTFTFILLIVNLSYVISGEKTKRGIENELHTFSLNQGEYLPLPGYSTYKPLPQKYSILQENVPSTLEKYIKKLTDLKKYILPESTPTVQPEQIAYVTVRQTKVLPAKIVQEGSTKHIYFLDSLEKQTIPQNLNTGTLNYHPENNLFYNDYYKYNQDNLYKPEETRNNYNMISSGYRFGKSQNVDNFKPMYQPQYPTKYNTNYYQSSNAVKQKTYIVPGGISPYFPGGHIYPEYPQSLLEQSYQNPNQQSVDSSAYASNSYKQFSYQPNYENNNNNYNNNNNNNNNNEHLNTKATLNKVFNTNPEINELLNAVNNGQGVSTADGFTMIKSKKDNAIYLIGKPGMSLSAIPDLSQFNFDTIKNVTGEVAKKPMEAKPR